MPELKITDIKVVSNVRVGERVASPALVKSIAAIGFLQPLVVNENNELIVGHGRLAAAKELGLAEVPVVVRDTNGTSVTAMQYAENKHREDLSPWEEAQAALALKDEGMKQAEVAEAMSIPKQEVSKLQKAGRLDIDDESATQFTLEGLLDLADAAKETSIAPSDIARPIISGEARDVHQGVRAARHELEEAEILDELATLQREWAEAGIEVTTHEWTGYNLPKGYKHVERAPEYGGLGLSVTDHINEPCHLIQLLEAKGFRHTTWTHWCTESKRHTKAGKSEVKAVTRNVNALSDEEKAERAANKQAKDERRANAAAWLVGKLGTNREIYDLAVPEAASNLRAETTRAGVIALIEAGVIEERPKGAEYDWYNKQLEAYMDERFGDDATKRKAFEVKLLHAAMYIESPSWQTGARAKEVIEG